MEYTPSSHAHPVALVILDGWGYSAETHGNALAQAATPQLDAWMARYPHTLLQASGEAVGLPPGYIGNSQVGHTTIGAGKIIKQPITLMNELLEKHVLETHPVLLECLARLRTSQGTLHIMGLLSDAGVHAHAQHLYAFMRIAAQHGTTRIVVHPFLDGRDSDPRSAHTYLEELDRVISELGVAHIGSIHGRFYAMDRDKHWDRTQKSYDALINPVQSKYLSWPDMLKDYYSKGITDEFIPPTCLTSDWRIADGDGIIFCNTRPDRARQLAACFVEKTCDAFVIKPLSLTFFLTPTAYWHNTPNEILIAPSLVRNTLTEILSRAGKSIYTIAETEKYAHVTYFFNGGREEVRPNEKRVLIPSLVHRDYGAHPAMSATSITDHVIASLQDAPADFYLINYANLDMVGHSGNLEATKKAAAHLDHELERLAQVLFKHKHAVMFITGDHGKAECMIDPVSQHTLTAHTTNPVPFIAVDPCGIIPPQSIAAMQGLADIAPLVVKACGI
jgi:2,3-bisphosphoglycerate-independent phosphoglycerate mutase